MTRIFLLPYSKNSKTVLRLTENLGFKLIRLKNSKYKPQKGDIIINWGNSNSFRNLDLQSPLIKVYNKPDKIKFITNKLNFFSVISSFKVEEKPRIPDWTQDFKEVELWLREKHTVFARTKLTGHSGEGIIILDPEKDCSLENFNNGQTLFVKYVKKKDEFRVHFFNKEIFDVQRKARVIEKDNINYKIRSHENGFIYSRNGVKAPQDVLDQALKTIKVFDDIDFGAIDIIYNKLKDKAYILEVNTAPGLEGTTLENYVKIFEQIEKDAENGS